MARRSGGSFRRTSRAKASRPKPKGPHKSAISGRFISNAAAARHPKTSYSIGNR